ncbi:transcription factor bHLH67 isoform X2 [Quercus suber]|uniref:transcription factor bHLH67 isoform X2 n=1 Tax=Quercus suber TaxID=58331 RepID=UPI0032DE37D6
MECWPLRERERDIEFKAYCNNYCLAVMERLQGPMNPCFFGDHSDLGCLEQEFVTTESLKIEEEAAHFSNSMLEDKMPFLQMLQSVGSPHFLPFKEPSFQTLLRLQHLKKPCEVYTYFPEMETQIQALELESCVTNDIVELHSPMKSETMHIQHPHSASYLEATVSSECNQEKPNSAEKHCIESNSGSPPPWANPQSWPKHTQFSKSLPIVTRERKKRKRARPTKNKEEVENQRMTHIAVERNRRRQMNDHLNVLRSLMPSSYIQRGDQASIIGGAIDFVKELEQLLHSLEAQKRMRKNKEGNESSTVVPSDGFFILPQCRIGSDEGNCGEEVKAENKSEVAEIEVTVIQTHVNLKIHSQRRPGQLLKAIVALEDLRLTVLHLNITSSESSVLYSFNLKMEDECKLGSADEIASKVHQIFSLINGS